MGLLTILKVRGRRTPSEPRSHGTHSHGARSYACVHAG